MTFTGSPTPVWQTYVDLQGEAKEYLQYPADKTDQDAILQRLLDAACWWVQDYLSRPIGPTRFQRRFDGWTSWQGSYIMLPYAPVLEVVTVTEYWGNSGAHVLAEQTPTAQFGVGFTAGSPAPGTYQLDPIMGKIIRTFPGLIQRPFFPGSRNIEIAWTSGFSPIPPNIMLGTLELFTHWYRNTQEQPRAIGQRVGEYGGEPDRNALWPAVPNRVTAMLEPYVQQNMG